MAVVILPVVDTRELPEESRHHPSVVRIQLVQGRMESLHLTEDRDFQDNWGIEVVERSHHLSEKNTLSVDPMEILPQALE